MLVTRQSREGIEWKLRLYCDAKPKVHIKILNNGDYFFCRSGVKKFRRWEAALCKTQ